MEEIILDTCAILWLGMGGGSLSEDAKRRLSRSYHLYFSPISAWEIMRKYTDGGIELPEEPHTFLERVCDYFLVEELPLTRDIMFRAASLPMFHKDPADRFIIATAIAHGMPVATGDRHFAEYGIETFK